MRIPTRPIPKNNYDLIPLPKLLFKIQYLPRIKSRPTCSRIILFRSQCPFLYCLKPLPKNDHQSACLFDSCSFSRSPLVKLTSSSSRARFWQNLPTKHRSRFRWRMRSRNDLHSRNLGFTSPFFVPFRTPGCVPIFPIMEGSCLRGERGGDRGGGNI